MFHGLSRIPRWVMTWRTALLIVLLSLALPGSGAFAKNLRIVTIESAPFGFVGDDGQSTGMMYEISNLIAQEAGFTYSNTIFPYARTAKEVSNGRADFVVRYGDPELTSNAVQVARVLSLPTIVVSKPSLELRTLKDLHGKTVAHPRGGWFDDNFERDTAIRTFQTNDYSISLKMLMADRVDAAIGSSVGIYYNAHLLGLNKNQLGRPLVLGAQHFELHFSKQTADDATISALRDAVARLNQRNEIKKIVNKYMRTFDWDLVSK